MRIAIDARLWAEPRSGIGRYTRSLTEHLLRLAPEERWVLYVDRPPGPTLPRVPRSGACRGPSGSSGPSGTRRATSGGAPSMSSTA